MERRGIGKGRGVWIEHEYGARVHSDIDIYWVSDGRGFERPADVVNIKSSSQDRGEEQ